METNSVEFESPCASQACLFPLWIAAVGESGNYPTQGTSRDREPYSQTYEPSPLAVDQANELDRARTAPSRLMSESYKRSSDSRMSSRSEALGLPGPHDLPPEGREQATRIQKVCFHYFQTY